MLSLLLWFSTKDSDRVQYQHLGKYYSSHWHLEKQVLPLLSPFWKRKFGPHLSKDQQILLIPVFFKQATLKISWKWIYEYKIRNAKWNFQCKTNFGITFICYKFSMNFLKTLCARGFQSFCTKVNLFHFPWIIWSPLLSNCNRSLDSLSIWRPRISTEKILSSLCPFLSFMVGQLGFHLS